MKIVYLIEQPLDAWNRERFGIQSWLERGWEVEVWDLTPLRQPRVWQQFVAEGRGPRFAEHYPIASHRQLEERYAGLANVSHFIDLAGDADCAARVKLQLVRRGMMRVVFATGTIPQPSDVRRSTFANRARKAIKRGPIWTLRWFYEWGTRAIVSRCAKPGIVVVSGAKSVPPDGDFEVLGAHNLDYDNYLRVREETPRATRECAVFIDQDYCFHVDYLYERSPFLATSERYFPAICRGLRSISRALLLDVRVAGHPRAAARGIMQDHFEGIPVEYGRTAEAVRDCSVVVCHDSTAVQYGVLFEKPMIFLTTDELNASIAGECIAHLAAELGKSVINVDADLTDVDWQRELVVDRPKYAAYRTRFIKIDGSPELPSWQIIIDHLEQGNARRGVVRDELTTPVAATAPP